MRLKTMLFFDAPAPASEDLFESEKSKNWLQEEAKNPLYEQRIYDLQNLQTPDKKLEKDEKYTTKIPLRHSELYLKYVSGQQLQPDDKEQNGGDLLLCSDDEKQKLPLRKELDFINIINNLGFEGELDYSALNRLLFENSDAQFGILSVVDTKAEESQFYTGTCFRRNAEQAPHLEAQTTTPASTKILINCMWQRSLSITRGIDYVLFRQNKGTRNQLLSLFKHYLERTCQLVMEFDQNPVSLELHQKLKELEVAYNKKLGGFLSQNGLAPQVKTRKQFSKLLDHYRIQSSLLDSMAMETFSTDTSADQKRTISRVKTSHPITAKIPRQKALLNVMNGDGEEKENYHCHAKLAFRLVNEAFAELAQQDDTRYSAQARKAIAPTIKNGYIETDIVVTKNEETEAVTLFLLPPFIRSGAIVYVGGGEEKNLTLFAKHNLLQLQLALTQSKACNPVLSKLLSNNKKVYGLVLVTDSGTVNFNMETTIREHTANAYRMLGRQETQQTKNPTFYMIYAPTNVFGRQQGIELPAGENLEEFLNTASLRLADSSSENRIGKIVSIFTGVQKIKDPPIFWVKCASGQDRSNAALMAIIREEFESRFRQHFGGKTDLEEFCFRGLHEFWITTLAAPGSPGGKPKSQPGEYFSKSVNRFYSPKVADTNKAPGVAKNTHVSKKSGLTVILAILAIGIAITSLFIPIPLVAELAQLVHQSLEFGLVTFTAASVVAMLGGAYTCYQQYKESASILKSARFWIGILLLFTGIVGIATGVGAIYAVPAAIEAIMTLASLFPTLMGGMTALAGTGTCLKQFLRSRKEGCPLFNWKMMLGLTLIFIGVIGMVTGLGAIAALPAILSGVSLLTSSLTGSQLVAVSTFLTATTMATVSESYSHAKTKIVTFDNKSDGEFNLDEAISSAEADYVFVSVGSNVNSKLAILPVLNGNIAEEFDAGEFDEEKMRLWSPSENHKHPSTTPSGENDTSTLTSMWPPSHLDAPRPTVI